MRNSIRGAVKDFRSARAASRAPSTRKPKGLAALVEPAMTAASRLLLASVLWLVSLAGVAAPADQAPLAQSALLTIHASVTQEWLTLHIQRRDNQNPVISKDVTVSVAGHPAPVSAQGNGAYTIPLRQLGTSSEPVLDIIVGHDGIREILSGKLALAAAPAAPSGVLGGHTQILWWVVNITVVFVAAILLSRRKPADKEPDGPPK